MDTLQDIQPVLSTGPYQFTNPKQAVPQAAARPESEAEMETTS